MHAKPSRTAGYRGRHRRPSRLRLLIPQLTFSM